MPVVFFFMLILPTISSCKHVIDSMKSLTFTVPLKKSIESITMSVVKLWVNDIVDSHLIRVKYLVLNQAKKNTFTWTMTV